MVSPNTFKERVRQTLIECSKKYKIFFLDYDYLVCSDAFSQKKYYIINAYKDNYLHLTGVSTTMSPNTFFERCINGTLSENDFSFVKFGQTESSVKGTVRRKIKVLPYIDNAFSNTSLVEENFQKDNFICSFATSDTVCTLGFSSSEKSKPMTLLQGNGLNLLKQKPIKLILRKQKDKEKFDEIIVGNIMLLTEYLPDIGEFLSKDLLEQLSDKYALTKTS